MRKAGEWRSGMGDSIACCCIGERWGEPGCFFLLLVASAYAFVTMKKIPQAAVPIIILFLSALGALLSGFLTARIAGKRGLPLGACSGLLLFLLLLLQGSPSALLSPGREQ